MRSLGDHSWTQPYVPRREPLSLTRVSARVSAIDNIWISVVAAAAAELTSAVQIDQDSSIRFFCARSGAWAQSRVDIAHAVGIDPDMLRERYVAAFEGRADSAIISTTRSESKGRTHAVNRAVKRYQFLKERGFL